MNAKIIRFSKPRIRICRLRNGVMEYREIPGGWNDCPLGWNVVCRFVRGSAA